MRKTTLLLAAITAASCNLPVAAQTRQEPTKVFFDDGKVRVQEVRFSPGDAGPNIPRPFRVIRVIEGGTMERTFPDGRKDMVEYRTGEVRVYQPDPPFVPRNAGVSDIVLFVIAVRDAQRK